MLKKVFFAGVIILAALDVFVPRHEPHFAIDTIPVFWSLFGLVGCLVLGLLGKWLLSPLLKRDEEYYNNE